MENKYHKYKLKYLEIYKLPVYAVCVIKSDVINGVIYFDEEIIKDETNKINPQPFQTQTRIYGKITGLNPNQKHAIHVHEYGDLTENCTSCCAHYNPFNKQHGDRFDTERHVGDLGNVVADNQGVAEFDFTDSLIHLRGRYSIVGRSFIVHKDEDDLGRGGHDDSKTTGHAGARIGCGVIGLRKNGKC